jgi:hypothetical protein
MAHQTLTKDDIQFLKGTLQVDIHRMLVKREIFNEGTLEFRVASTHIKNCEKMIEKLDNLAEFPEL